MKKVVLIVCLLAIGPLVQAERPKLKACKNFQTGKIVMIEAGYPCPSGTVEI
jgi:hypothetical protein